MQEYLAVEPYVVVGALTDPFAGAAGAGPQSTRVQLGAAPLQVPPAWQVIVVLPDRLYPVVVQEYVAVAPYVVVGALTDPFAGAAGAGPQSTRVQLGAAALQVPSAWQVIVAFPARLYPEKHW